VATGNTLIGSNEPRDEIGKRYNDLYFAFIEGANGGLVYREKQSNSTAESDTLDVVGKGNDFTAYFISEGTSLGVRVKQSTIISGTLTPNGIENYRYSFVMLEKGPDPDNLIVPVETYRIFKDGDDLAEISEWYRQ
jgi:hypothetical protein